MTDILEICYKKFNKEITTKWSELAVQYGFKSGEAMRTWFKRMRKKEPVETFELDVKIQQFRDERNYLNKTKRALSRTENMLKPAVSSTFTISPTCPSLQSGTITLFLLAGLMK